MSEKRTLSRRKRRRRRRIYAVFTALIIVVAATLAINFLFRVENVEVNGADSGEVQKIVEASGIEQGKCIYLINKFTVAEKLAEEFTYIEDIDIYRRLPDTIVIDITQRTPSAMVQYGSDYWILDENCIVLDKVRTLEDMDAATAIVGLDVTGVNLNEQIAVPQSQQTGLEQLKKVLVALSEEKSVGVFSEIDVTDPYSVRCKYGDSIEVLFGNCENMNYRVRFFKAIIDDQSFGESGIIDITDTSAPRFIEN